MKIKKVFLMMFLITQRIKVDNVDIKKYSIIVILIFLIMVSCNSTPKYSIDLSLFQIDQSILSEIQRELLSYNYSENDFKLNGYSISSKDLKLLIDVNRIIAFIKIKHRVTSKPFVDVELIEGNGERITIITRNPDRIDAEITWKDKSVPMIDIEILEKYRVNTKNEFLSISIEDLLSIYFDENGYLKREHRNGNVDLYYALIQKGLYLYTDSYSGRVRYQQVPVISSFR